MAIGLPDPKGTPQSLREELSEVFADIREFRAAELPDEIQELIHAVAMNSEVSGKVATKLKTELVVAHGKYFKICIRYILVFLTLFALYVLASLPFHRVSEYGFLIMIFSFVPFYMDYSDWRAEFRDPYIAHFLIRTLEFGLRYQSCPTDERIRDGFATMIQRTAVRYARVYKHSYSTRFFVAQVRKKAKACRNDIISLIPGLVTASQDEIRAITEDITRLLIRTQTGYWHQTSDIARHGMPMQRRDMARIALYSFIRDRSIQVALIALTATAAGTTITLLIKK